MSDEPAGVHRVTVSLDPIDVDLIDRLADLEGSNRSAELRSLLFGLRPMLQAAVEAFEGALDARGRLDRAAAEATVEQLAALMPHAERMQADYLGALAALEGAQAADPRSSSHGGHTPLPPSPEATS